MRETNTQKNWNEYFDNPKRPHSDIRWGIVIFMVFCVGCAVVYSLVSGDSEEDMYDDMYGDMYVDWYDDAYMSDPDYSARVGEKMAESVEIIKGIFYNIEDKTTVELNDSIKIVRELELSAEYEEFRQQVIKKLSYYIDYKISNNVADLEEYNKIHWIDELAVVFDQVGVEYEITKEKDAITIELEYYN